MNVFQSLRNDLQAINRELAAFLSQMEDIPGAVDPAVEEWRRICSGIEKQMTEDVIRVAVVGAIKSGKSTFINSMLQSDYLKRGAGVVTSIVTRIRSGPYLKAVLYFKSWDEVNSEIEQALTLFPQRKAQPETERFDIRREKDRQALQQGLASLHSDLLIANGSRSVGSILLESYLNGYDGVKNLVASESTTKVYEDDLFDAQKSFVGSDSLAVYLKDIQLEINSSYLGSNIEIADCQGSDSPNPLHLAMIQDYLLKTHLIIYVISSRTGLRQADIRFLTIIKQMGIIDTILFVINCDFSEHESTAELMTLIEKTRSELSMLKPEPQIYALSSLYNLFKSSAAAMSQKDSLRLSHWEHEEDLVALSDRETASFQRVLSDKLSRERYRLLLKNNIERLGLVAIGLQNTSRIRRDILNRDARGVDEVLKKIEYHLSQMAQIRSIVKSTLDGSSEKIKKELKEDVDRFFDPKYGAVLQHVKEYIRNYQVDFNAYEDHLVNSRFTDVLFLIFQDFKTALDTYVAESVNPKIIKFIRGEETKARAYLASVGEPYESMIQDAITGYHETMNRLGIPLMENQDRSRVVEAFKSLKNKSDLILPPIDATMRYSARIKTEAVLRLGVYSMATLFKKLFHKAANSQERQKIKALKDGVNRVKNETEKSVVLHFKDYRENIKFQYIFKLTDLISRQLHEILLERFRSYSTDVSKAVELVREKHEDKEATLNMLRRLESRSNAFAEKIKSIREEIESAFVTEKNAKEV